MPRGNPRAGCRAALPSGEEVKHRQLEMALRLLRALAQHEMDGATAETSLGLHRREWHRYLNTFTRLGIPLRSRWELGANNYWRKIYWLNKADWCKLIR